MTRNHLQHKRSGQPFAGPASQRVEAECACSKKDAAFTRSDAAGRAISSAPQAIFEEPSPFFQFVEIAAAYLL
jgi:hypothetical protein